MRLDRSKIATVGKKAIGEFLVKLQVLKSTADRDGGAKLWEELTTVNDEWQKRRDIVLKHKKPRPVYVQAHHRTLPLISVFSYSFSRSSVKKQELLARPGP